MKALALVSSILAGVSVSIPLQAEAQEMQPGDAVVTRFSGTVEQDGRRIIDAEGAVASILNLRQAGGPPRGEHWFDENQSGAVTAAEIGQVFGVALDDATPPNIYVTATSVFGLHRSADNSGWMDGLWGEGGGPGTIWKLNAANDYRPEIFADITTDGRANSGAALGNIAFDRWNRQLYVSDLETGMIHRLSLADGVDLGTFDHGANGRTTFMDAADGQFHSLEPVAFDPASGAQIGDCPSGDFSRTPSCWNFADFRRRVWGVGVRQDAATGAVRLYYAVWSSQGFGNPDYAAADENEQRNSVWSVGIDQEGSFNPGSVRREFFLPDFFRSPEAIARAGRSHPVADIAFPTASEQNVMLVAERGGVRNLGLSAENAFSYPDEARVLRYELGETGAWRGVGRYDVGYYDRSESGPPYMRAGAAGGISFGMGYRENGDADPRQPDGFVWMTGDGLCSPRGECFDSSAGTHDDGSEVSGLQGQAARPYEAFEPITAFQPYPAPGPVTPSTGPDSAFMIDVDVNTDANGDYTEESRTRNDSTRVGDVAVFQPLPANGELMPVDEGPVVAEWPDGLPEEGWIPAPPPDDGWFLPPPFPLDTDLAIRKTGPAQCQEGVECTYVIRIRNVGLVAYTGPLAVSDTMPAGATLASTSPGWHCIPGGATFRCITNAPALLVPGATAAIEVNILLPAAVPGPSVQNCTSIDWFEMGTDDGPGDGNDDDCVTTPVSQGFDLGIEKTGPAQCAENAECHFDLVVTNYGPGEFNGPLAVRDIMPAGATYAIGAASCTPAGRDVNCLVGDITLPSGAATHFLVRLQLPDGIAGGTVTNCAEINWSAMTSDDGAADVHADSDCHTVNVINKAGFFDLQVTKRGPAHCNAGGDCEYEIEISNIGPDDYTGELHIQDTPATPGLTYVGVAGPGWGCGAAIPVNCNQAGGPHTLHPGDTRTLHLTLHFPNPVPVQPVYNCVDIRWGAPGMPVDDNPPPGGAEANDHNCTVTLVDTGFDTEIAKTGPAVCYEGAGCDFTVSVTNNGPGVIEGIMGVTDTLPAGATLEGVDGALACNSAAAGTVSCFLQGLAIPPGSTYDLTVHTRLPDPVAGNTVENCASIDWTAPPPAWIVPMHYTGDDNAANDGPACATVPVLAADLAPWGATTCRLGSSCPIEIQVDNRGGRLFQGAAGLHGMLDPGVTISSIESQAPGFDCQVTGTGQYECEGANISLKPGASAKVRMVLEIPADFPHRRIIHRKEMIWPDQQVKDDKPENDRHTSTIMILQPEEPQEQAQQPEEPQEETPEETPGPVEPTPPPVSTTEAPDLSVEKSAGQRRCEAGRPCDFRVTITNNGSASYVGPLRVSDVTDPPGRLTSSGPRPWRCRARGGGYDCTHPATTLAPGESVDLSLTIAAGRGSGVRSLRNCASLVWNNADQVRAVQIALNRLGFPAGRPDGRVGPNTRGAVRQFQESAGLPATGRIDEALLRHLFASWGEGDGNAANDDSCVTIGLDQPVQPPPVVEPPLACPPGYAAYRNRNRIPRNSEVLRRTRGNQVLFCARPRPQAEACPRGYRQVSRQRAKDLARQGWDIRQVGNLMCARPVDRPALQCPGGYKPYPSRNRIPRGYEVRTVRGNGQVLYCARPQPQVEACPRGYRQVSRQRAKDLVRQGWEIRQVGRLMCARPGSQATPTLPTRPNCTGGRVWDARRNACVCRRGSRWDPKRNRCLQPQIQRPQKQPQLQRPQRQPQVINPQLQLIVPRVPQ
ncbi:peptidoglycan-binding protein [uncultured Roseibium sp.]|uniref:peptidoglycan-binding protein n=1 Tax=uncultured Roseibium sp. TaxID=1936171 RepID=UPI0032171EB3